MTTTTDILDPSSSDFNDEENTEIAFKIIIYIVGVIGNLLVIFVILFLREYKKITHWYVLQMALADLLFMQVLPFKLSEDINGSWIHATWLCKAQQTVLFFTYYASIMFLMIMAIDRYLAVCHPLSNKIQRLRTIANAYIISLIMWIVALLMSIPLMLYSDAVGISPTCVCTFQFPKDPLQWCTKNSFTGNMTQSCVEDIFPRIHASSCSSDDSSSGSGSGSGSGGGSGSGVGSGAFQLIISISTALEETSSPEDNGNKNNTLTSDSPVLQFSAATTDYPPGCLYDPERPGLVVFIFFNFIVMFIVPLVVIIFCYGLIIHRLTKTSSVSERSASVTAQDDGKKKSNKRRGSSVNNSRAHNEKTRVTMLCALLALLFTVCWLPFHSVHLAKYFGIVSDSSVYCSRIGRATIMLAYLSSATNPYLYNFLGSFKKRLKQIKKSRRMQSFISATGFTRTSATPTSIVSFTEGTRGPKSSMAKNGKSEIIPESIPLKTTENNM